jgi:caffeoyl-CoA O-methyltransferase
MEITSPKIDSYILGLRNRPDPVLRDMEKYARERHFPIIGPLVGPFLRQIAYVMGAKKIFEMGSGFGYSAYWFAGGLKKGGKIICTDGSEANYKKAQGYFKRAGIEKMVDYHVGDALDIINQVKGQFDIILNDIDKLSYPLAFDLAMPRLKSGGIFITDNVLWSGRILDSKPDKSTKAILEFNRKLFKSKDVIASIIPIRDGLGIAVKR